jgi:hypothetical protein
MDRNRALNFKGGGEDGNNPFAGLIFDSSGALYGTTYGGAVTVFKLTGKLK